MARKKSRKHKKYMPVWKAQDKAVPDAGSIDQTWREKDSQAPAKGQMGKPGLASHRGARTSLAGRHK